jgi:hypothetical protein
MASTISRICSSRIAPLIQESIFRCANTNPSSIRLLQQPTARSTSILKSCQNGFLFSTKSSFNEPLHKVLEQHLLKNDAPQMSTSQRAILKFSSDGKQGTTESPTNQRSSNHHYTSVQERSRLQQQAVINGLIAFSVVVLACQNLKASVEKRQLQEQLQQQQEQCDAARQALKQLLHRPHMDAVAAQILQEMESTPSERSSIEGWWRGGNSTENTIERNKLMQLIADRLEQHLHNIVGDAALEEAERDLKKVQALTTPSSNDIHLLDPESMGDVLAALNSEIDNETTPKVVKKRIFSM